MRAMRVSGAASSRFAYARRAPARAPASTSAPASASASAPAPTGAPTGAPAARPSLNLAAAGLGAPARSSSSTRAAEALELRRRLLDPNLSARECLQWLPGSVQDAVGQRTLNAAGVKKHYKLLAVLVHPDKHADDSAEEQKLWTEAYKRLGAAKGELLRAMGCLPSADDDDDDEIAQALVAEGKFGAATDRYRKVAAELTSRLGPTHPQTFRTKMRLANVLRTNTNQTGEAEGARPALRPRTAPHRTRTHIRVPPPRAWFHGGRPRTPRARPR